MDEYITRNNAISAVCFGCNQQFSDEPCEPSECSIRQSIMALPTADVVPKSEVEELEAECERQYEQAKADILANMADGGTSCYWCIDEHKAQAKAEVAREIFAEIERLHLHITNEFDVRRYAELKKKIHGAILQRLREQYRVRESNAHRELSD